MIVEKSNKSGHQRFRNNNVINFSVIRVKLREAGPFLSQSLCLDINVNRLLCCCAAIFVYRGLQVG